jgi:hypothetical protein
MHSPPLLQFLSRISKARGAIPGAFASSLRLSECGRVEKNIREELTKGPRLAVQLSCSPEFRDEFIWGHVDASCASEANTKVSHFSFVYCARVHRKIFCMHS